jgi:hypothetical protein
MAKYGVRRYGTFKYGQLDAIGVYFNSGITASAIDYNKTYIKWNTMNFDPNVPTPTHWRLIKSFSGTPDNPFDGVLVQGGALSSFSTYYTETFVDKPDSQVNYSIWLFNSNGWIFCGAADTIVVNQTNTLDKVTKWIPRAWLNQTVEKIGDATGEPEPTNALEELLYAYTYMYDHIAAEGLILERSSNKSAIRNSLIVPKILDLGFNYEPVLGDNYFRTLYAAGNEINTDKGTAAAVRTFTTALTHWGSKAEIGHNLLLDYNDSSFEESVGRWIVTGSAVLTRQPYSTSLADLGTLVSSTEKLLVDPLYPPRAEAFGLLTTHTTSTITLNLPDTSLDSDLYGVPVKPNTYYVFSGWIQHLDSEATINAVIHWWDGRGHLLSSTTTPTNLTTDGSWQEFTSYNYVGREGSKSPNTASFATVTLNINSSSSAYKRYALDMFQFAEAKDSYEYEDARRVRVYVKGDQENYVLNPDFENGIGFWTPSPNGSFAQDPTIYPGALEHGATLGELTILSGTGGYITSDWISVDPEQNYTFSGFVSCGYTAQNRTVIARIEFSNRATVEAQSQVITDANGQYLQDTPYYVDSDPYTLTFHYVHDETDPTQLNPEDYPPVSTVPFPNWAGTEPLYWEAFGPPGFYIAQAIPNKTSVEVTGITPPQSRDSGSPMAKVSLYFPDAVAGDTLWVDGLMLQETNEGYDFFGGDGANTPVDPVNHIYFSPNNCIWEIKNRTNFINNPSIETLTDWTADYGTLSVETGGVTPERIVNPNGSLGGLVSDPVTHIPILYPYSPLYGTYMGQCTFGTFGVDNPGGIGELHTTVYLPAPAKGGEDFVVSVYVRGGEGTYRLYTNKGAVDETSNRLEVIQHDQYQWIRLQTVRNLLQGETSFVLDLTFTQSAASAGLPQTNYFQFDGFQAEFGRTPTKFIDPSNALTKYMPNPGNTDKTIWMNQEQSQGGGKSSYFYNYFAKQQRLYANLELVMPHGSTYCVKPGFPTKEYQGELVTSLIPSASFEKDLGEWLGVTSILTRIQSTGTLAADTTVQGTSYCRVTSTKASSSGDNSWAIKTSHIPIYAERGYYGAVAVRPSTNALGVYTMTNVFYGPDDSVVRTYTQTYDMSTNAGGDAKDFELRWSYIGNVFEALEIVGASYMVMTAKCVPAAFHAGQYFDIDRCVFRE